MARRGGCRPAGGVAGGRGGACRGGWADGGRPAAGVRALRRHEPDQSESLPAEGNKAGLDVVTLAFVVSAMNAKGEPICAPAWGAIGPIGRDLLANGTTIQSLVRAIRKAGGDVIVSFGGANPMELALACPTAAKLQAAYQAVVDRYKATSIDLDVERRRSCRQSVHHAARPGVSGVADREPGSARVLHTGVDERRAGSGRG